MSPFDTDRLSRALVARDSSERAFSEILLELDAGGSTLSDLARVCGVTRQAMHQWMHRARRSSPTLRKRDEAPLERDDTARYGVLDRWFPDYLSAVAYAGLRAHQTGLDVFVRGVASPDAIAVALPEKDGVIIEERSEV